MDLGDAEPVPWLFRPGEDDTVLSGGGTNRGSYGFYDAIHGWTKPVGAGIELQNDATLGTIEAVDGDWYVEPESNES